MREPQELSNQPSPYVFDATDQDFTQSVIERSHEVPVLVDFWAPWCAPCRTLGPLLEKLVDESQGRFLLAKVNVDENQQLAQALQIRSIPAVKLIMEGKLKDEFMGAYPEPMVREFLDANLPSAEDLEAEEGVGLLKSGDTSTAQKKFEETLATDPKNAKALVGLGLIKIDAGDLEGTKKLLDQVVEQDDIRHELAALQAKVYLTEHKAAGNGTSPNELEGKFAQACQDGLQGRYDSSLAAFLEIVKRDRKFKEDGGRKGMVAVFAVLPPDSPLIMDYRGKLSLLLFS
jgi:putative thioredoxin